MPLFLRFIPLGLLVILLLTPQKSTAVTTPHDELRGVKQEIRAKQNLIKKTQKVEADISVELKQILKSLDHKEAELKGLDKDLSTTEGGIRRTELEIVKVTDEAKLKQRQIERRLTSLYKAGELGSLRMFFASESFPQMAENMRFMKSVLEHDKRIFAEYKQKIEEMKQLKIKLEQDARRKERIKVSIADKKKEIEEEKRKKSEHLQKVRNDRHGYEASLKELQANAAKLQSMLNRLEAESRRKSLQRHEKPSGQSKPLPELPAVPDRGFSSQKGRMPRPVNGSIIETYGKHKHPEFNSYTFNKGIFISSSAGAEIKSVYDGTVIYADYFKGYGNMIIIDHGGGYFTLYAHASRLNRKVGAEVDKGETVAIVGDIDSTRGTVLYFEIRHQGKPIDPAGWIR